MKKHVLFGLACASLLLSACDNVGSQSWCAELEQKDKPEWTEAEAQDYAQHCIFADIKPK